MVENETAAPPGPGLDVLRIVAKRLGASDDEVARLNSAENAQFLISFLKENGPPATKPAAEPKLDEKPKLALNKASGTPPDKLASPPAEPMPEGEFTRRLNTTSTRLENAEKWNLHSNDDGFHAVPIMVRRNYAWEVV